ncbi:MAG: hypothetical protein ACTHNL_13815 [Devosia sp.]|jgi:hypothetical protein
MIFALLAAPAAWVIELLAGFAFTSYFCFRGDPQFSIGPPPGWLQPTVTAINIFALIIAIAAAFISFRLLRRTGGEREKHSGDAVEAGEGRTRVFSLWGLTGDAIFIVAIAANVLDLFLVPLCWS